MPAAAVQGPTAAAPLLRGWQGLAVLSGICVAFLLSLLLLLLLLLG